jgi:hypothetical protein
MKQEPLSQSSSRFAGIRKGTLILALPFVLFFLLAEVTGRLLEQCAGYRPRRTAGYLEGNPYLRTALVPGMRFRSGPYRIDVNSLGFRGPEIVVPKPPETMRIFALGESSTFGWKGARSHEEAWPGVLETKLRTEHPGRRIEVINAGVPGYTSIEQRINFMLRISHLQPDAAVCRPGWFTRLMEFSYVWMEVRSRIELFSASSLPKNDAVDSAAIRMLEKLLPAIHRHLLIYYGHG